jgi:hypothetical protein
MINYKVVDETGFTLFFNNKSGMGTPYQQMKRYIRNTTKKVRLYYKDMSSEFNMGWKLQAVINDK